MISTPVMSSALPLPKLTTVEAISRRLIWPCRPIMSTS